MSKDFTKILSGSVKNTSSLANYDYLVSAEEKKNYEFSVDIDLDRFEPVHYNLIESDMANVKKINDWCKANLESDYKIQVYKILPSSDENTINFVYEPKIFFTSESDMMHFNLKWQ